eukprot:ctg_28.g33
MAFCHASACSPKHEAVSLFTVASEPPARADEPQRRRQGLLASRGCCQRGSLTPTAFLVIEWKGIAASPIPSPTLHARRLHHRSLHGGYGARPGTPQRAGVWKRVGGHTGEAMRMWTPTVGDILAQKAGLDQ